MDGHRRRRPARVRRRRSRGPPHRSIPADRHRTALDRLHVVRSGPAARRRDPDGRRGGLHRGNARPDPPAASGRRAQGNVHHTPCGRQRTPATPGPGLLPRLSRPGPDIEELRRATLGSRLPVRGRRRVGDPPLGDRLARFARQRQGVGNTDPQRRSGTPDSRPHHRGPPRHGGASGGRHGHRHRSRRTDPDHHQPAVRPLR